METPEFKPLTQLTFGVSYAKNVRQYGPAPKGYRWMKIGETINHGTDLWAVSGARWGHRPSDKTVLSYEWPWITPIPKTDKISLLEAEVAKARAALAAAEKKLSTARELVAKLEAL